jgi:cytochrome c biogenesis protein CcmG/thiol:disulfide interchange protein DsbE
MKKRERITAFILRWGIFGLVLSSVLCSCARGDRYGFNPGEKAPDVKLAPLDGSGTKLTELSSFRGKVVLLNFWASWCGPCVVELPALQRLHDTLAREGFSVVSIAVDDTADAVRQFKERFGLTFPILLDEGGGTKDLFKLSGVPESFIIDREGKFQTILDPDDDRVTFRLVGPRDWASPNSIARFRAVLK